MATASVPRSLKRERTDDDDPPETKPRKRAMATKECTICCSDTFLNRFPRLPHIDAQKHSSDVCFKCWDLHLKSEVESKGFEKVGCPQCGQLLEEPEVRKLAKKTTYASYLDNAAKKYVQSNEEYHACPNGECNWGAFFAKDDGNILNCPMCKARYCISCEVPFHEGQTCEEHLAGQAERQEQNKQSLETVAEISKPCPECKANIDKYAGCDHVTCSRCRHEFCWLCSAPYNGPQGIHRMGNSAHLVHCAYTSARLPNLPRGAGVVVNAPTNWPLPLRRPEEVDEDDEEDGW